MPTLIRWRDVRAEAAEDPYTAVADDTPLPKGDVIVSLTRFQQEGERLLGEGRSVGVRIEALEAVEDLAYDLPRIAVVALVFPKYRQGQHYSSATLLRERYGYRGEVRAAGEVLREQARIHGALRLRRLRAGRRIDAPRTGAARRPNSATSTSVPPRERAGLRGASAMSLALEAVDTAVSLARRLDAELRHAHPKAVIAKALEIFGDELALVSSFGAESRRAAAHGRRGQRRHSGAVPRHRHAVRPDARLPPAAGREAGADRRARPQTALRRPGDRRSQRRPLEDRHRRLLPHPQGAAAEPGAGRLLGLDHRAQALPRRRAAAAAGGRGGRGQAEVQSARQLDQGRPRRLRRRPWPARAPAGGVRLPLARLLAVHQPGGGGRRRPLRPLGRLAEDRVRHPHGAELRAPRRIWAGIFSTRAVRAAPTLFSNGRPPSSSGGKDAWVRVRNRDRPGPSFQTATSPSCTSIK